MAVWARMERRGRIDDPQDRQGRCPWGRAIDVPRSSFESSTHTLTVDKNIPEDIKTRIRQSAEDKGMTVDFQSP